ncbi:hypothetical protein [Paraburkholderia sp. J12]|uniref:hypothetical protein n=1 Tax=Paraburkholderia sp. J12 TaxID=2805432 RepID=UPI002ABDC40D|nr:hypothetical protein [Paraburkholderia sp. J12]
MSNYVSTIITVVVTFIVTFVLNVISGYFSGYNGELNISNVLSDGENSSVIVSITNYSSKFIDGVTLEIPAGISVKNFRSDSAVRIIDSTPSANLGVGSVKISQITPKHVTTILVSGLGNDSVNSIRLLNASEARLRVKSVNEVNSPLTEAAIPALFVAAIQAIFLTIFSYFSDKRFKEAESRIEELRKDLKTAAKEREDLGKRIQKTTTYATKLKILLLGRISDYSKELEFWRNLIKESLLSSGFKELDHDNLIKLVTDTLKTHGTITSLPELDAIKIAAGWLRDEEKKLDKH